MSETGPDSTILSSAPNLISYAPRIHDYCAKQSLMKDNWTDDALY